MEVGNGVYAFLGPENIILSKTFVQSRVINSLKGKDTDTWMLGALVKVKIDCGITRYALITRKSTEERVFFQEPIHMLNSKRVLSTCSIKGDNL